MKKNQYFILGAITLLLSACGGGSGSGSSSPATPAQTAFPFFQAYKAMVTSGVNTTFTAATTGPSTCAGSGSYVLSPSTTGNSFNVTPKNTVAAIASSETFNFKWTVGTCANETSSSVNYYASADSTPLGNITQSGGYSVFSSPTIPQTVHIGDSGPFLNVTVYTDNTEQTVVGNAVENYTVSGGSTTGTALFTITRKNTLPNGTSFNDVLVYSLTSDGTMKPVSELWGGTSTSWLIQFN